MPTAYLSPSQLQDLTNVSSTAPGSGDNGKALVWNWNNTTGTGQWQAEQVAYANLSGAPALPIPVASGGTGTQTGSITGTEALTFASSANGNISLSPNGTGKTVINNDLDINLRTQTNALTGLKINLPQNEVNRNNGIYFAKGNTSFAVQNITSHADSLVPAFVSRTDPNQTEQGFGLYFAGIIPTASSPQFGSVIFATEDGSGVGPIGDDKIAFAFWNWYTGVGTANPSSLLFRILGNGNASLKGALTIQSTASSTNTTSGALQVAGGIGVQGNLIVGGTRINYANLPTSPTATGVEVGDLWRDGDVVKVKL